MTHKEIGHNLHCTSTYHPPLRPASPIWFGNVKDAPYRIYVDWDDAKVKAENLAKAEAYDIAERKFLDAYAKTDALWNKDFRSYIADSVKSIQLNDKQIDYIVSLCWGGIFGRTTWTYGQALEDSIFIIDGINRAHNEYFSGVLCKLKNLSP